MNCCSQPFVMLVFPKHKMKLVGGQLGSPLMQNSTKLGEFALTRSMQTSPSNFPQLCSAVPCLLSSVFSLNLGTQEIPNLNSAVCHGPDHVSLFSVPSSDHSGALRV